MKIVEASILYFAYHILYIMFSIAYLVMNVELRAMTFIAKTHVNLKIIITTLKLVLISCFDKNNNKNDYLNDINTITTITTTTNYNYNDNKK